MQNSEQIQALLDKYWLGETTLDEERSLKAYFATPIDERFRPVAPLFQTLRQEQAVQLERSKVVPLTTRTSVRFRWAVAASIAALLAVGAWWLFRPPGSSDTLAKAPVMAPAPVAAPAMPAIVATPAAPSLAVEASPAPVRKHTVRPKENPSVQLDPETEKAMAEIKAALSLVSAKLNKGKKAALKDLNHLESIDKFLKPKSDS